MNTKKLIGTILIGLIFFANFAEAYDLPKNKVEKPSAKKVEDKGVIKSDWTNLDAFEEKLKILIADEKILPVDSEERIYIDNNIVFVAIYKGNFYFLDRASIKIRKNKDDTLSWRQRIFPLGKKVSSKKSEATEQTFFTDGENFYNSSRRNNNLSEVKNAEDKKFLLECLRVGYYYAFGKEISTNNKGDDF